MHQDSYVIMLKWLICITPMTVKQCVDNLLAVSPIRCSCQRLVTYQSPGVRLITPRVYVQKHYYCFVGGVLTFGMFLKWTADVFILFKPKGDIVATNRNVIKLMEREVLTVGEEKTKKVKPPGQKGKCFHRFNDLLYLL